ncbi:hypothetical protein OPV22_001266 [Ensete ventricosum]|uniref:Uncharacterized protein n=1 Tax=Ensete ventricosum TaxID=4639 RepID=A0AAV8RW48_ENSVE|nr:hypothetical protein OPV22_001266 [Ensete ventricosum]
MVLWEMTLAKVYFLGLKRTYRIITLRIQRRLLGPRHPELRQFPHRRTSGIFDQGMQHGEEYREFHSLVALIK